MPASSSAGRAARPPGPRTACPRSSLARLLADEISSALSRALAEDGLRRAPTESQARHPAAASCSDCQVGLGGIRERAVETLARFCAMLHSATAATFFYMDDPEDRLPRCEVWHAARWTAPRRFR